MQIHFNNQNQRFGILNNSKIPFGKPHKDNNSLNKLVDMLNQRGKDTNSSASASQSVVKSTIQKNKADDIMLSPQEAAKISAGMNKAIPKFDKADLNAVTRASLLRTEAMSIDEAVSSMTRKINDDGTITAPNLEDLRENGLSPEINYEELDAMFNFKTNYRDVLNVDSFAEIADYIASTYAVLQQRIQNDFSGEEQTAEFEKLDAFMAGHIDRFSMQFADAMGDFSAQIGVNESKDKFYESVKEAIYDQTKQYQEYIAENRDYARINDTADSWLNRHTEYMSSNLRSAFSPADSISPFTKTDALYSKNELASISSFAKTATEIWNDINVNFVMSEEEIGLKLGMMALAVDVLSDKSNAPEEYKKMAAEYTKKVSQEQIDKVNKELNVYKKPHIFPELNTSVISHIVDAMRDEYANTKNISSAIQKGSALGYTSYNNRLSMFQSDANAAAPHRYSYQSAFWSSVYPSGDSSKHYQNPSILEKFHATLSDIFHEDIPFSSYLNQKA